MHERLMEALREAESSAGNLEVDEIAFLFGSFPESHWIRGYVSELPRIKALLPEMMPCGSEILALLQVAGFMNRDDIVGRIEDLIRKLVRQ